MRENKLYANLKKCVFCAPEIPVSDDMLARKVSALIPRKCRRYVPGLPPGTKRNYVNGLARLITYISIRRTIPS